jgi:glycosyltransferase involved in cell wall biosynthesis
VRILFFSTAFPQPYEPSRNPDNLERCVALARYHDVEIISPFTWRRIGGPAAAWGRLSTMRGLPVARPLFFYPPGVLRGAHAWCMWQGVRRTASRIVARFRPDAVLGYWTYPDTAVAATVAQLAGVPCVAIVGGSDVLSIDPNAPGGAGWRAQRVLRSVDMIAAVSGSIKDRITALGIASEKVHVLPAAVDKNLFFPGAREEARRRLGMASDAKVLVWVGRMVAVKALDTLFDAVGSLSSRCSELRLYLVGDGPLRRSLQSKAHAAGLASKIIFTGCVTHRDLPDYYRAADVTVLPSAWEGMPNTLLESQACGTPFVASAVGAIPELAGPNQDELVTPGDSRQLADAIAASLQRSAGNRGRVICRAGGWDDMAAAISGLLSAARRSRALTGVAVNASAGASPRTPRLTTRHRFWGAS